MNRRLRAVVCISVVAAFVAGCGGAGGPSSLSTPDSTAPQEPDSAAEPATGDEPGEATGELDDAALNALAAEFAALDPETQLAQAGELSAEFERQRYEAFGLTEALGGTVAADQSIAATAEWMATLVGELSANLDAAKVQPRGFRSAAAAPPSIAQGLFGGLLVTMLGAEGAVTSTNDVTSVDEPLAEGVRIVATAGKVELTTKHTFTDSKGVTTTLESRNVSAPCPKADGTFEASATIDTSSTVNGGATGERGTFDVAVKGTVDDDANLVSFDTSYRGQFAEFVERRGGFLDVSGTRPATGDATFTVNRGGGTITDGIVETAVKLGVLISVMVEDKLVDAAKKGWESGRCVELTPTVSAGPKGLAPSASVTITAAPRSKIDAGKVGGSVTATLTGGGSSVAPSATKVPADATFTYVAPDKKNETGTVALEARSRRGVGKATIDFDTKQSGYTASGGGGVEFSGTVSDLSAPFTLSAVGDGFTVEFSFTPTDARSGSLAYSGGGGGVTMSGTGTYSISGDDPGPLAMAYDSEGCVAGGGCRANSGTITLTPIAG